MPKFKNKTPGIRELTVPATTPANKRSVKLAGPGGLIELSPAELAAVEGSKGAALFLEANFESVPEAAPAPVAPPAPPVVDAKPPTVEKPKPKASAPTEDTKTKAE